MTDLSLERTRTFSWQDPLIGATAARTLSGLEYLQAIAAGTYPLPPIADAGHDSASERFQ